MTDNQKSRYKQHIMNKYLSDINNYNNRLITLNRICICCNQSQHQPNPPYNIEEIPEWYPEILKYYLTEISREIICNNSPCRIILHDKNKTLNEIHNDAINTYYKEIGNTIEEQRDYFEYELENVKDKTLSDFIEYGLKKAIIDSTLIFLGSKGCTFEDYYCPITDKVTCLCYDTLVDTGIVDGYDYLIMKLKNGESFEDYIW